MTLLAEFTRVSKKLPCPICGRHDWCLVSRDDPASRAICKRTESRFKWGEAGWMHRLRDDDRPRSLGSGSFTIDRAEPAGAVTQLFAQSQRGINAAALAGSAAELGVSVDSLERLEVGFLTQGAMASAGMHLRCTAATFPMRGVDGAVIGLRLRIPGRKFAIKGSRNGLFIPRGLSETPSRLLVAEGESDTAALLDLGFDVVGRPGCTSCVQLILRLVKYFAPSEVVVVSDNDHQGRRGAADLARQLRLHCGSVRVLAPPGLVKDARAWKNAGATRGTIEEAIATTAFMNLSTRVVRSEVGS